MSGRAEPHRGRVVEASLVRRSAELEYSCTVRISGESDTETYTPSDDEVQFGTFPVHLPLGEGLIYK